MFLVTAFSHCKIFMIKMIFFLYFTLFRYGGNAKVVHFLGKTKPWSYTYDPKAKQITENVQEGATHSTFLLDWWNIYSSAVVPMLQEEFGDEPFQSGCVEVNEPSQFDRLSNIYNASNMVNDPALSR